MPSVDRAESRRLTRREVLALGGGAFVVATMPVAAGRHRAVVRRTVPVMGTVAELAVVHREPRQAHAAIDAAIDELRLVERRMTRFTDTSDVGRANRRAASEPVALSAPTAMVLREALAWAYASEGAFDPAVGRAVRLWDVSHRRTPPAAAAVRRLAGRNLYRAVDLDTWRAAPVVRFTDPEVELDLGGIAKGYAVDRAVDALRRRGIEQAIVNVGGDLYALGSADDGGPWRIGVRSPADPDRLAGTLEVRDAAVATSGDYVQYFVHGARRYHHLLDPTTGAPRLTATHSVTVLADTCLAADAAATAMFGMAPERADRLLRSRAPGGRVVGTIEGIA